MFLIWFIFVVWKIDLSDRGVDIHEEKLAPTTDVYQIKLGESRGTRTRGCWSSPGEPRL